MFPLFSKLERQVDALRAVFVNIVKYVDLIVYPIMVAVIALAPEIVSVLYGQGYLYADTYMRLHMLTFCYIGLSIKHRQPHSHQETRIILHQTLINFTVTIPLGFMLIPRHGVNGLIISRIIGPLLGFTYGLYWIRKNLDIEPDYVTALKTILAAASAGLATHLYANTVQLNPWTELLTGGALCILIYIASVLLLGALKQEDLDNLENISRGLGPIYPIIKKILTLLKPLFKP